MFSIFPSVPKFWHFSEIFFELQWRLHRNFKKSWSKPNICYGQWMEHENLTCLKFHSFSMILNIHSKDDRTFTLHWYFFSFWAANQQAEKRFIVVLRINRNPRVTFFVGPNKELELGFQIYSTADFIFAFECMRRIMNLIRNINFLWGFSRIFIS